jgi:hypothetical protein
MTYVMVLITLATRRWPSRGLLLSSSCIMTSEEWNMSFAVTSAAWKSSCTTPKRKGSANRASLGGSGIGLWRNLGGVRRHR